MNSVQTILIEPSSFHFLNNQLFNANNAFLNRDGTLLPFVRLQQEAQQQGITTHTSDACSRVSQGECQYWSLGTLSGYKQHLNSSKVSLTGFVLFEPPLVAPKMYEALPQLTKHFEKVYVHNIVGDGYSLKNVDQTRLRKLYWPQPYLGPVEPYFSQSNRLKKLVVIAGSHNPRFRKPELYSERIRAVAELVNQDAIDLYGRGWDRTFSRHNAWWPYWRNRSAIARAYKGPCVSKLEVLSQYNFSLCFENMPLQGYITEKIFDCLYAGTVPVYWGAPDVAQYIPRDCWIDATQFESYNEMWTHLQGISDDQLRMHRSAMREFLMGNGPNQGISPYFESMQRMVLGQ